MVDKEISNWTLIRKYGEMVVEGRKSPPEDKTYNTTKVGVSRSPDFLDHRYSRRSTVSSRQ